MLWRPGPNLGECLLSYENHLRKQAQVSDKNKSLTHPVRTIGEFTSIQHRSRIFGPVDVKYQKINQALIAADGQPVFFDEDVHIDSPFEDPVARFRFHQGLQLGFPIDILKFSPWGSQVTTRVMVQVAADRPLPVILTDGARLLAKIKTQLKEVHSRAQRRNFQNRLMNITIVTPSVRDFIYQELTYEGAAPTNPAMQERLSYCTRAH